MKIWVLCSEHDDTEFFAFKSEEAAERAWQQAARDWLDVSEELFDPRVPAPQGMDDPIQAFLWRCGIRLWIEEVELSLAADEPEPAA